MSTTNMTSPVLANRRRRLAFLFSLPILFGLLFFSVSLFATHISTRFLETQELSISVAQLRSLADDCQAGERGYVITGEERSLVPLQHATSALPMQLASSVRSARDQPPDLLGEVKDLSALVSKRAAEAMQVVQIQNAKGMGAAIQRVKTGEEDLTMNQIRLRANELQSRLNTEASGYLHDQEFLNRSAFYFFAVGTAVMVFVLARLFNTSVSFLQARDDALVELQNLNAQLEMRVEERTRDLQRANDELQQFAYVASHDLQEPLRTITSFTQLLASRYRERLDPDADEFIDYIVSSARRMTDLINGLLTVARLRKSGHPAAPVNFSDLVEEAKASLHTMIQENGASITCGPLPSLVVDRVQFTQVIQNLISNAIKYRSVEPPVIRVEAQRDISNWVISFSDNGAGFQQEYSERIFGFFQRLHNGPAEGTGMGLAIARKIVERHGGRIWAESKVNLGSTFFVSLPVSLEISPEATESNDGNR
jgi:signal transduction histidine kinase